MVNKILGAMFIIIAIGVFIYGMIASEAFRWFAAWIALFIILATLIPKVGTYIRHKATPHPKHKY